MHRQHESIPLICTLSNNSWDRTQRAMDMPPTEKEGTVMRFHHFCLKVQSVRSFLEEEKRYPCWRASDPKEKKLGAFVKNTRQSFRKQKLCKPATRLPARAGRPGLVLGAHAEIARPPD